VDIADVRGRFRSLCEDLAPSLPEDFCDDTDLTEGLLDSFAFVVLFEHVELAIGRELRDEERGRGTVGSVSAIAAFIAQETSRDATASPRAGVQR
jgi:hypothetical protein